MKLKNEKKITVMKGVKAIIPAGAELELINRRDNTLIVKHQLQKFSVNISEVEE